MRFVWRLFLILLVLAVVTAVVGWPLAEDCLYYELSFYPGIVLPGDLLALKLTSPDPAHLDRIANVTVAILDLDPLFVEVDSAYLALVGIPSTTEGGRHPLLVNVVTDDGLTRELHRTFEVGTREFPIQHLRAGPALTGLLTTANLTEDRARVSAAMATPVGVPQWQGPFLMPVEGRITTEYGQLRYVNNAPSGRPHSGLDIAAVTGTPVLAAADGIVTFSGDLHVSGKTVILDHGLNLFTDYLHLSATLVEVGETVVQGEAIGLVGSTGFSTGPHLHWTVLSGSTPVNPWLFLELDPLTLFDPEPVMHEEDH